MKKIKEIVKNILKKYWTSDKTIDIIWKYTSSWFYKYEFNNKKELLNNLLLYKKWKRKEIEYILRRKILINKEQFWVNNFYQNYPPLNFKWDRDTLSRFKTYELEKYLNKEIELLDIWWNLCFFSLYTSKFVKSIDIVEYNPNLAEIWNILKEHEKIENVEIMNLDFKQFNPNKKYDIIFSFAIHIWVWLPFINYLEKIHWLLKDDWFLFIESNDLKIDPFEENINNLKDIFEVIYFKDSNDHKWYQRKIALLKKI